VSPEPERSVQQPPHLQHFQRRHSASDWEPRPPQHEGVQPQSHGSPGKDRRAEVSSRVKAAWAEAQRSGHLSVRQSARIADLSLLLDVVLKTNTLRCAALAGFSAEQSRALWLAVLLHHARRLRLATLPQQPPASIFDVPLPASLSSPSLPARLPPCL
jgi:hypothetical protein